MRRLKSRIAALVVSGAAVLAVVLICEPHDSPLRAQEHARVSLGTDWSHRHLVYSNPSTLQQSFKLRRDARYLQQYFRRNVLKAAAIAPPMEERILEAEEENRKLGRERGSGALHRDWSEDLGSGATAGANQFPAKFSFDITTANCANAAQPDFVVYNTSLAGAVPAKASGTGTFNRKNQSGTVTVDGVVLTASTTSNTGTNFQTNTSTTADATNLAAAINRNLAAVSATSAGAVVTVTATTAGAAGNSIAISDTLTNFTWSGTTLAGGSNGTPSVTAFDNLYSGCTGTVPSTYWQYNTGGSVTTSVTLSGDGSQVAFVQAEGGIATLVLLKWAANPAFATLTAVSNSAYPSCTAPCMTTIALHGNPTDTLSSPFYVYDGNQADTLYVGDDAGTLHKFHPVFSGTPAEVTSSWPIVVNSTAGTKLSGPVYDGTSGNIYMTDSTWLVSYVRDTGSTVGTCTAPCKGGSYDFSQGALGTVAGGGAPPPVDSPIVDSTSEMVFVFAGCTLAGDSGGSCGDGTGPAQVVQLSAALANPVGANVGLSSSYNSIHLGAFDNNYYSGSYSAGRMIVCGNPNRNDDPIMYVLTFNASGVLSTTAVTGPTLATTGTSNECSPLTEVYNPNATGGPADWVFGSVKTGASPTGCSGAGCMMNFVVTAWQPTNTYTAGQMALDTNGNLQQVMSAGTSGTTTPSWSTTNGGMTNDGSVVKWKNMGAMAAVNVLTAPGGTSGIIIDNTVGSGTLAGASQVYYTTLANGTCATSGGTGGCAVQASQAALH